MVQGHTVISNALDEGDGAAVTRGAAVPDPEAVSRWAAWYEALPADLRDALDEIGRGSRERIAG